MADGFYTNDDGEYGCFGGYGSDGAWAYADDSGASAETSFRPHQAIDASGADASTEQWRRRPPRCFEAGGGCYGRAA